MRFPQNITRLEEPIVSYDVQMIIGGVHCDSSDGKKIASINPATNEVVGYFPAATKEDCDRALACAQKGKVEWAAKSINERAAIMNRFADLLEANLKDLATIQCLEMGKPIATCEKEISGAVANCREYAKGGLFLKSEFIPDYNAAGVPGTIAFSVRQPVGVCLLIAPFNAPTSCTVHKAIPALMAGNAIIMKPPSDVALTVTRSMELLLEAGVPGNAAQIVTGSGAVIGKYLVETPLIDLVSLTGSTEVGQEICRMSAPYMHRTVMELGGNDPVVVFEDADMKYAVSQTFLRVVNTGQMCIAPKRWIVHNSIKEEFVQKCKALYESITVGDPMDRKMMVGTLINERAAKEIEEQVNKTVEQGARIVCGGTRNGAYYMPTVLTDVTKDMDIAKDMEIFGPVLPIIGFDTEEEAIEICNQSCYGLSAGIITQDYRRGLRVAFKIQSGGVQINGESAYRNTNVPFGGMKMSGLGREGTKECIEHFTELKSIIIKDVK